MSDPRSSIVDAMARRKLALDDEARGNYEAMQPPAAPAPQSGWERDDVLPFARRVENGQRQPGWSLAAPKFLADAVETAGRVGSSPLFGPQRIGQEPREEMVNAAGAVVGPMAGVGIGRAAMAPKGGGELGIFGGRMARTADHAALARAEKLAAEGAPRERIWDDTGWFKGPDDQWRFEIDDSAARWKLLQAAEEGNGVYGNFMQHDKMFDAYPALQFTQATTTEPGSFFDPSRNMIGVRLGSGNPTRTALHEGQHAIANMEGMGRGASYADDGPDLYNRSSGEVEARAVEKRMPLTAEQRKARPPWLDYDVPEAQQIVRMPK